MHQGQSLCNSLGFSRMVTRWLLQLETFHGQEGRKWGRKEGETMPILRKAKFSQKSPSDFSLHVISRNCVTWPLCCRETRKSGFVDEHTGGPNKSALEEQGVKSDSEAAGNRWQTHQQNFQGWPQTWLCHPEPVWGTASNSPNNQDLFFLLRLRGIIPQIL